MQISITAGIPETKRDVEGSISENTKNPEITERWHDEDSGVIRAQIHM